LISNLRNTVGVSFVEAIQWPIKINPDIIRVLFSIEAQWIATVWIGIECGRCGHIEVTLEAVGSDLHLTIRIDDLGFAVFQIQPVSQRDFDGPFLLNVQRIDLDQEKPTLRLRHKEC